MLEKQRAVLEAQNSDLTRELQHFVEQDEILRAQLDRRCRVQGIQSKNEQEVRSSQNRVQEVTKRQPSPIRQY